MARHRAGPGRLTQTKGTRGPAAFPAVGQLQKPGGLCSLKAEEPLGWGAATAWRPTVGFSTARSTFPSPQLHRSLRALPQSLAHPGLQLHPSPPLHPSPSTAPRSLTHGDAPAPSQPLGSIPVPNSTSAPRLHCISSAPLQFLGPIPPLAARSRDPGCSFLHF